MSALRVALFFLAVLPTLVATARPQELVWRIIGADNRNIAGYGTFTTTVGDVNGDEAEDLLVIVNGYCWDANNQPTNGAFGYLWLISGRDGQLIREVPAPGFGMGFATIAPAGDANHDGVADYVANCDVRSGVDDSVLWTMSQCGYKTVGGLDTDGDGQPDVVTAAWQPNGGLGACWVHGAGGLLRYTLAGDLSGPTPLAIGNCVASLGDVDDDGKDDFVMGCFEPTGRGAAVVVSGDTGSYLRVCYGELPGDGIGLVITACGDLDGDGYQDFATGNGGGSFVGRGVVRAFSSRTGQVLFQWTQTPASGFSTTVVSRGVDVDGDGVPDVITGQTDEWVSPQYPEWGWVEAYSGRDGSRLCRINAMRLTIPGSSQVGFFMSTLQPPPGEPVGYVVVPDMLAFPASANGFGGPNACGYNRGAISCYRGLPRTARPLGAHCAGTLPEPPDIGMRPTTNGVRVQLAHAPAAAPAVLLLGLSQTQVFGAPLPLALDPLGFPGCFLRTSIDAQMLAVTGTTGADRGHAFVDLPHPVPASGQGLMSLTGQWVVLGAGAAFPGGLTQAITWRR